MNGDNLVSRILIWPSLAVLFVIVAAVVFAIGWDIWERRP